MADYEKCALKCTDEIKIAKHHKGRISMGNCVDFTPKQTNADHIQSMNIEELAKFLSMCVSDCQGRKLEKREFCKGCPFDTGVGYCTDKRIKKWLQSETE